MSFFFLIARVGRAAYKGLRAAAGILILSHGVYRWLKNGGQRTTRREALA